jgi:hypothetical protein
MRRRMRSSRDKRISCLVPFTRKTEVNARREEERGGEKVQKEARRLQTGEDNCLRSGELPAGLKAGAAMGRIRFDRGTPDKASAAPDFAVGGLLSLQWQRRQMAHCSKAWRWIGGGSGKGHGEVEDG